MNAKASEDTLSSMLGSSSRQRGSFRSSSSMIVSFILRSYEIPSLEEVFCMLLYGNFASLQYSRPTEPGRGMMSAVLCTSPKT